MIEIIKNIDWEKFHFLREEFLWVSIPIFIIILIGIFFYSDSNSWKKKIAPHLRHYVIVKGTEWKSRFMHVSILLMFVFGLISFFGPSWDQIKSPTKKIKSKFVIVLDLSQSMLTEDVSPNRLERAKFKIKDLLDANPGAETSLLVFSGSTHTVIPFTTDYKIILDQLDGLKPSIMPASGTSFLGLFSKLDSLYLDNKAQGRILLITDDFDDVSIETASSFLQDNNVQLYLYPFATQSGGKIPRFNQTSKLNTEKINSISSIEKATLLEITLDDSDVIDLAKLISDELVFEDKGDEDEENWKDNGFWFIIPLAFLFLFSFRKGWALHILLIGFTLTSCSSDQKKFESNFQFEDLWYTKEYQAQKEYDLGNYKEAAQNFEDPFRKGVSYYKAGDLISARTAFEKDSTTQGMYNLGLVYAKLGQLDKSQELFEKVIQLDPTNKNAASNLNHIITAKEETAKLNPEEAQLDESVSNAKNKQNKSPEDLSGGGQEATKKQMEKERLEETVKTETRKGKELEELPDDFKSGEGEIPKNILMRKVDDDPALFLKRKFKYQIKKKQVEAETNIKKW